MFTSNDHKYMARALQLAECGRFSCHPNPRVGCVIVCDEEIIGEGFHERAGQSHAEVNALAQAGEKARGATVYVTLEPCSHQGQTPPCSKGLVAAGVGKVIVAMVDPNPQVSGRGLKVLDEAGIATFSGLMEKQAKELNPGFVSRMLRQRPFVRLKMAGSLDGRTAMADGDSVWITGLEARQDVQRLRAQADAIITGIGTVLVDDPSLNVRYKVPKPYSTLEPQSERGNCSCVEGSTVAVHGGLRIILDSQLQISLDAKIINITGKVIIFANEAVKLDSIKALQDKGVEIVLLSNNDQGLDLQTVMKELAKREINECHLECGAKLAGAFVKAQLVDEIVYYMAPCLMGSEARPLLDLSISKMLDKQEMQIGLIDRVGEDVRMIFKACLELY